MLANRGVEQLTEIVGAEHISTDINTDRQDTAPFARRPLAYVTPGDTRALKEIFTWARATGVQVWTSSQGRNWGYGATVPLAENAIVVLLRRLNRIVELDRELAYAVIEPGVTYNEFYAHVREHAPELWIDCIDGTPNGSVLGNALERGVGPTPYGDHYGQLCGLEVLLPNGRTIQTGGMGAAATLHTYRWGRGPVIDGLFSQSNLGVVVKAGIWLMPKPQCFRSFLFESHEHVDFAEIINAFRRLFLNGTLRGAVRMINTMVSLSLVAQYPRGPGECLNDSEIEDLRREYGIAPWTLSAGLYGTTAAVGAQRRELKRALGRLGRLEFLSDAKVAAIEKFRRYAERQPDARRAALERILKMIANKPFSMLEAVPYVHGLLQGRPTEYFVRHAYFKMPQRPTADIDPARDGCGVIWFAPIVRNDAGDIQRIFDIGREVYAKFGFEFHVALIFQNPRSTIVLMSIFYFRDDERERERAAGLEAELARRCAAANFIEYRTGVSHMASLYAADADYLQLLGEIKSAVDPGNLLAPGRYNAG